MGQRFIIFEVPPWEAARVVVWGQRIDVQGYLVLHHRIPFDSLTDLIFIPSYLFTHEQPLGKPQLVADNCAVQKTTVRQKQTSLAKN